MPPPVDQLERGSTDGREAVRRLRALPPDKRAAALDALDARGLLAALDPPPGRVPSTTGVPTVKQQNLHRILRAERTDAFYQCGQLWLAPDVSAGELRAAWRGVAGAFEALRTEVDRTAPSAAVVEVAPVDAEVVPIAGDGCSDPDWRCTVTERAALLQAAPLPRAARSVRATVFDAGAAGSALLVHGSDLLLDQQGLQQLVGPALEARLRGCPEQPAPIEKCRLSELAGWQQEVVRHGVLGLLLERRRAGLAGLPRWPWPTAGDRTGRRVRAWRTAGLGSLRDRAAAEGVSLAAWVLTAWRAALAGWAGADGVVGCCSTLRVLPEFATTLGNLTNTVIVPPGPKPSAAQDSSPAAVQRLFTAAIAEVQQPFELVFPAAQAGAGGLDEPIRDEQVGVRFTWTEAASPAGDALLIAVAVPSRYAKSVLSAEIEVVGERLTAWVDHRPALPAADVDRLALEFGALLDAGTRGRIGGR